MWLTRLLKLLGFPDIPNELGQGFGISAPSAAHDRPRSDQTCVIDDRVGRHAGRPAYRNA
jgi:hypothetical protein